MVFSEGLLNFMKNMEYQDKYLPVDPDFIDVAKKYCIEKKSGKVHYFSPQQTIEDVKGTATAIFREKHVEYLEINELKIRLDKIITLFGKPGPSYEAYDRFANACLTCEDLGQF